jgi:hypothetical protein
MSPISTSLKAFLSAAGKFHFLSLGPRLSYTWRELGKDASSLLEQCKLEEVNFDAVFTKQQEIYASWQ